LREGAQKKVETLRHVIFECGFYATCRIPVADLLQSPTDLFTLSRDCWSWSQLRALKRFFPAVISTRNREWRLAQMGIRSLMQEEVDLIWS
jgi:hypothetical protein